MEITILDGVVDIDMGYVDADEAALRRQIEEYAACERADFSIRVERPESFTGRVMAEMQAIPFGETRTYGELADRLDSAAQAVGQAAGGNPVPIVVPCHRVIAADGLGGYSAAGGPSLKERLLRHEGAIE